MLMALQIDAWHNEDNHTSVYNRFLNNLWATFTQAVTRTLRSDDVVLCYFLWRDRTPKHDASSTKDVPEREKAQVTGLVTFIDLRLINYLCL